MTKEYIVTSTGEILQRRLGMFYWRGRCFSGLVAPLSNALYDDPEDSFCEYVGLESSLEKGLIKLREKSNGNI